MKYSHYLYFGSNEPSPKYYKAHFSTDEPYIKKSQFKDAEKCARNHIYGDNDEAKTPILISYLVTLED